MEYEIRNTEYKKQETGDERETGDGIIWYAVRGTFCIRMRMRCGRNKGFGSGHVACMYVSDQVLVVIFVFCLDQPRIRRRPEKERNEQGEKRKERMEGREDRDSERNRRQGWGYYKYYKFCRYYGYYIALVEA